MRLTKLFAAVAASFALAIPATAQEGDGHDALMMEWMEKYAQPGPEHEYLKYFVGDWTFVNTNYSMGEPVTSEGTAHYELVLDGRYLSATHAGESGGMAFEGMGISGFDRATGECFQYWIDSMGTGVLKSRGKIREDGKGDLVVGADNSSPWGPTTWRMVTDITGEDTFTFKMYMASLGEPETLAMQIEYTRVEGS